MGCRFLSLSVRKTLIKTALVVALLALIGELILRIITAGRMAHSAVLLSEATSSYHMKVNISLPYFFIRFAKRRTSSCSQAVMLMSVGQVSRRMICVPYSISSISARAACTFFALGKMLTTRRENETHSWSRWPCSSVFAISRSR